MAVGRLGTGCEFAGGSAAFDTEFDITRINPAVASACSARIPRRKVRRILCGFRVPNTRTCAGVCSNGTPTPSGGCGVHEISRDEPLTMDPLHVALTGGFARPSQPLFQIVLGP